MKPDSKVQTHSFQTEVQQLLQLMIHSLYSNKEIFLRELISNASDACDKLRFVSLTDNTLLEDDEALGIWIDFNPTSKTITIRDNGIGMNEQEVIENIGTIARSGTKRFMEQMNQSEDADNNFIGQFGVGFYSSFLVSKNVTLTTRKAGAPVSEGIKWTSDGSGEYTIETVDRPQRGTEITLKINKEDKEYLEKFRVRNIISKYSDHISLPIQMLKEPELDEDGKPKPDQEPEWEAINKGSALWTRGKKEISDEEHNTFYTSLTYDPEPPMSVLHNRVEGKMEYISLFYIPSKAPYDLWDREQRHGIKLYVRRIFISDDAKQLMPNYLRFVRGLVDSADLPLNVSREFLQQNKEIDKIRTASVKKILSEISKIAKKDNERYLSLWKEYGRVLKEGLIEDMDNKETLSKLIRFSSTNNGDEAQTTSLDDYIARMPEKQSDIYYVTADSHAAASSSPHLEVFRKNDIEVLLLSDPVDEWVVSHLTDYEGKALKSISKGDLDLDTLKGQETKEEEEKRKETMKPMVEKFQSILADQAKEVRISNRLVDSPSCLVADQNDLGGNMERILQAIGQEAPVAKPILEINPDHEIVQKIDLDGELVEDWAQLLFDQAALAEGVSLKNPGEFVKRMNKLLTN
ncbi:MAG: molecular chaperone HtpG [Gammaproteobacteria bacterium]|nr:molecular chaperone HtpG [Gammaproteobacteria bacterium]